MHYLTQLADIAYGRSPNGTGQFTMLTPTFQGNNDITSTVNQQKSSFVKVYPNPFFSEIIINTQSFYSVTDSFGRLILDRQNSKRISTSKWRTGIYFIHLDNENKEVIKLIKIK